MSGAGQVTVPALTDTMQLAVAAAGEAYGEVLQYLERAKSCPKLKQTSCNWRLRQKVQFMVDEAAGAQKKA